MTDDLETGMDQLNDDLAVHAQAVEEYRQQAEKYGRDLWQALNIISDMHQCHPTNDAIGKRARDFLHKHRRN